MSRERGSAEEPPVTRQHDSSPLADEGDRRFATRLLASAARYELTPGAEARVRAAVMERRFPRPGTLLFTLLLRPAVVVALLVGASAVAGATFGRQAIVRALRRPTATGSVAPALGVPPARSHHSAAREGAAGGVASPAPVEAGPEAALVEQAMNALRRDHEPARASRLLDEYRSRYPDGALAEEALVLAIEAAVARHDDAAAAALGTSYLGRYPKGRFAAVARAAAAR
jgi:hypothetical protein